MALEVELPLFRGPLELLLQLIERRQLEITAISLVTVTEQYLDHLRSGQVIDSDDLADFIVVAAKLLYLKARSLLPQPEPPAAATDPTDEDEVAQELVAQLLDYKRAKETAQELRLLEERGQRAYPRLAPSPQGPSGPGLAGVTLDSLLNLLRQALERTQPLPVTTISAQEWRLKDRIGQLRDEIVRHGRLSFRSLLESCQSRGEVVVTFLALLELIKAGQAQVRQDQLFDDIAILPATEDSAPSTTEVTE